MWIDDRLLEDYQKPMSLNIWRPKDVVVVLGNGNQLERECYQKKCKQDGIKILKRYGGGGAVVLHPGCVIVSIGAWVANLYDNQTYFDKINQALIDCLQSNHPNASSLCLKGISDIAWNDHKVAGTSIFRSRNYLLYQASLLIDAKKNLINAYLKHPSREPEYRKGKPHSDFIEGLDSYLEVRPEDIEKLFKDRLLESIKGNMNEQLIEPQESQFKNLRARLKRSQSSESCENSVRSLEELRFD